MKKAIVILILLSGWIGAWAQEVEFQNKGAFEFIYANDFTGMNDQYYTNGVGFALTLPVFYASPFNPRWLKNSNYSDAYHTLNFQYDVFTPDLHAELYSDRPFAATMMLGSKHQYVFGAKNFRITSELRLGLIGQAAGAGTMQNGLHAIMPGADEVKGWDTQVRNDVAVNYVFAIDKRFEASDYVEITTSATAYLGIPYTKLEPSVLVRIGIFENIFNFLNNSPNKQWQTYLIAGGKASFVGYNATLQGGLFNPYSPYVLEDINHFVANYHFGIGAAYRNTSLSFTQTFTTPEFSGATSHSWGELRLMFRF